MALTAPPGYQAVVPLDREKHGGLGVAEATVATELNAVYLTAAEFFRAAHHFPIVFASTENSETYLPMALTGLKPRQNLFVDGDGTWRSDVYVPAYLRRYPFCTVTAPNQEAEQLQFLICVDESALSPDAPALFTNAGEPTEHWAPYEQLINEMESARLVTEQLVAKVVGLDLLEPFEAQAHPKDSPAFRVTGLSRVNEDRLNALAPAQIKELMQAGLLSRIYAHLISLDNFAALIDLYSKQTTSH